MLFNSLEFLLFFPIVCIVYFLISCNRWRNTFLLVASYYFYMCWEPVYALLLLTSTAITYSTGLSISRNKARAKLYLTLSLIANLAILFFFKYYAFAAASITSVMEALGILIHIPSFHVLLPVGISFYIFQALGYSIDVYRGEVKAEHNFFTYALFVSFFPQLVAGPIERSTNLLQQFKSTKPFEGKRAIDGITLMLWGYFLKLVLADNISPFVNNVYGDIDAHHGGECLLASAFFCFQLYGDFAGYSFIAIGCAKVLGFSLMENFRRPYFFSTSVQDFWKRNHISLTTWFMDYIYYPMVGTSTSLFWWCLCIFITFVISGFWHGAAWTYVVSFALFGVYLVVCLLKDKRQRKFEKQYNLKNAWWWQWSNRLATFFLVMLALVFFRAETISDGFKIICKSFSGFSLSKSMIQPLIYLILLATFAVEYAWENKIMRQKASLGVTSMTVFSFVLVIAILLIGRFNGGQFIYFQF